MQKSDIHAWERAWFGIDLEPADKVLIAWLGAMISVAIACVVLI